MDSDMDIEDTINDKGGMGAALQHQASMGARNLSQVQSAHHMQFEEEKQGVSARMGGGMADYNNP